MLNKLSVSIIYSQQKYVNVKGIQVQPFSDYSDYFHDIYYKTYFSYSWYKNK